VVSTSLLRIQNSLKLSTWLSDFQFFYQTNSLKIKIIPLSNEKFQSRRLIPPALPNNDEKSPIDNSGYIDFS